MDYKDTWYTNLTQSKLTPPNYVFSIVWPILYTTIFISFMLVFFSKKCKSWCLPLTFFVIGFVFNVLWSYIFFTKKKPTLALIDLGLVILFNILTMVYTYPINPLASYVLLPYMIWISFAFYLNLTIVLQN